MTKDDMIDRYIYAATKRMPSKIRKDVAAELMSIIDDMLVERCGDVSPTAKDVRVVLTELGTPFELSLKYNPNGDRCLIGQPYYSQYLFVLRIVLISIGGAMLFIGILSTLAAGSTEINWNVTVIDWLGMMISGLVYGFAFVTIIFAVFCHKGVELKLYPDGLDSLPPVPKSSSKISKWESIVGIVFSVVFAAIFLAAPQIIGIMSMNEGVLVTFFNVDVIRSTWYIIIAFAVCGILSECVKLIDGRYTNRVMMVVIITDVITGALAFFWLIKNEIINPQFLTFIANSLKWDSGAISFVMGSLQNLILTVVIIILIVDIVTVIYKTQQAKLDL